MSAKLLQTLTDENRHLQKQIGCMSGIFQIFDRHHIFTSKRQTQKKLPPPAGLHPSNGDNGEEINLCTQKVAMERDHRKKQNESQPMSLESSQASFTTSSCSSSFSSLECDKGLLSGPVAVANSFFDDSLTLPRKSQNSDFREVVRESINKDASRLTVKTTPRERKSKPVVKNKDSPRPVCHSRHSDISYISENNVKAKVPVDLNESLRVLAKLRDAPSYFSERREPSRFETRDGSLFLVSKDSPRFSCDDRETPRASLDSRDSSKSSNKLRDLPRLSFDSRESLMKSSNFHSKANLTLNERVMSRGQCAYHELERRSPSIVEKLMGLDVMIDSSFNRGGNEDPFLMDVRVKSNSFASALRTVEESKHDRVSASPRNAMKDPNSPRPRSSDSATKPVSGSRYPLETAPWRQKDRSHCPQEGSLRSLEFLEKTAKPRSVYSEVEKRLKELEFQQSSKDLRALKQILEAMQVDGSLESKKDNIRCSNILRDKDESIRSPSSLNRQKQCGDRSNSPRTESSKSFQTPIVIVKPAKVIERSDMSSPMIAINDLSGLPKLQTGNRVYSRKDLKPMNRNRQSSDKIVGIVDTKHRERIIEKKASSSHVRSNQTSPKLQKLPNDNNGDSLRNSSSLSPRLLQRKLDLGRSGPPITSSDSTKTRRQINRQPVDLDSPCRKGVNLQHNDGKIRVKSKNLNCEADEISIQSDSNVISVSHDDIEVTSTDRSDDATYFNKKSSLNLRDDASLGELTTSAPDQPSPVSVLDNSFYKDDLQTSPVKKISLSCKDNEMWTCQKISPDNGHTNYEFKMTHKSLEDIDHLIQKLRRLDLEQNSNKMDYMPSLCLNMDPDNQYILDILLASGLMLRDLGNGLDPIELHPSGRAINPDLFFVIEQMKMGFIGKPSHVKTVKSKNDVQKIHRKLIFDALNEMIVPKLTAFSCPWLRTVNLADRYPSGQKLLNELCADIGRLKAHRLKKMPDEIDNDDDNDDVMKPLLREDMNRHAKNWSSYCEEIPSLVLDVERLLFKDLVNEVVGSGILNSCQSGMSRFR